jgi:hypothetical protein
MNQQSLIKKINDLIPEAKAVSTKEFYGEETEHNGKGIWLRGSELYTSDSQRVFNYNAPEGKELHPIITKIIKNTEWRAEPYDCATCMLWI